MKREPFQWANAHFVTEQLLVGGDIDCYNDTLARNQVVELFEAGVTHIVDCREEMSDEDVWGDVPEIDFRWHPVDDAGQRVPGSWFDAGVDPILEAFKDPDARVLTHCHMGINRGPSLGFAVLLALGWDPVAAIDAIRSARSIANVYYAEDALAWWHRRSGASPQRRTSERNRLAVWRDENWLDVRHIIAGIRDQEAS